MITYLFFVITLLIMFVYLHVIFLIVKLNFILGWIMGICGVLCIPLVNRLDNNRNLQYEMAHEENNYNPLYIENHIRYAKKKGLFFMDLKGFHLCQMITFCLMLLTWIYYGCVRYSIIRKSWTIEDILLGCYLLEMLLHLFFWLYYKWRYKMGFRYIENRRKIWMPFSCLILSWNQRSPKYTRKGINWEEAEVNYSELRETVVKNCSDLNYTYRTKHEMDVNEEACIWTKETQKEVIIFELIHVKEYKDEHLDKLNNSFEEFWSSDMSLFDKEKTVKFISFMCVDKRNSVIKKRLLCSGGVDQSVGRYRFPVFGVNEECFKLYYPMLYSDRRGKEEFREMKEEFQRIILFP